MEDVTKVRTVDQIRADRGEPPMPNGMGEVILNPVWLQWAQIKMGQAEGGDEEVEEMNLDGLEAGGGDFGDLFGGGDDEKTTAPEDEPGEPAAGESEAAQEPEPMAASIYPNNSNATTVRRTIVIEL